MWEIIREKRKIKKERERRRDIWTRKVEDKKSHEWVDKDEKWERREIKHGESEWKIEKEGMIER